MPATNDFVQNCYLNRYPDLANGWMYWSADNVWKYGKPSNRRLKELSQNLLWHWQNFGQKEGRVSGCDLPGTVYDGTFNAEAYMARYPDVRTGIDSATGKPTGWNLDPYSHYLTIGAYQGRKPGYEIITANSPQGITSPGTVKVVQGSTTTDTNTSQLPGDTGGVLQPINPTSGSGAAAPSLTNTPISSTTNASTSLTSLISGNSLLIGGLVLGAILIFGHHKSKHSHSK